MKHTKWIAAACAALAFGFVACSDGDSGDSGNNSGNETTVAETKTAPDAVGDIVLSDGTAISAANASKMSNEQKSKAVAVIFYVGTELNSGDDTTTSRTLGVGLAQNQSRLVWCTHSANANNKNITSIQCTPSGEEGAYTFTGDKDGSDNLTQIGAFLTANGSTDDTATADNYPAFYYAKNYASQDGSHVSGTDYADGWYLPSIAELFQEWKSRETVNAAIEACGGTKFNLSERYRSSSQHASGAPYAYTLGFDSGECDGDKLNSKYVCVVRAF